jgi:hypothetical protein
VFAEMKKSQAAKSSRKLARRLGSLAFVLMGAISLVVFFTEDQLGAMDYVLLVGAPFALAALAYFVGLHYDPNTPE